MFSNSSANPICINWQLRDGSVVPTFGKVGDNLLRLAQRNDIELEGEVLVMSLLMSIQNLVIFLLLVCRSMRRGMCMFYMPHHMPRGCIRFAAWPIRGRRWHARSCIWVDPNIKVDILMYALSCWFCSFAFVLGWDAKLQLKKGIIICLLNFLLLLAISMWYANYVLCNMLFKFGVLTSISALVCLGWTCTKATLKPFILGWFIWL